MSRGWPRVPSVSSVRLSSAISDGSARFAVLFVGSSAFSGARPLPERNLLLTRRNPGRDAPLQLAAAVAPTAACRSKRCARRPRGRARERFARGLRGQLTDGLPVSPQRAKNASWAGSASACSAPKRVPFRAHTHSILPAAARRSRAGSVFLRHGVLPVLFTLGISVEHRDEKRPSRFPASLARR
jgi:hypothetical protein